MGAGSPRMIENEQKLANYPKGLTAKQDKKIANQQNKSLCRITTKNKKANGFLCNISNDKNIKKPVLITNNHVLSKFEIQQGKKIKICFTKENGKKHRIEITIDEARTTYTLGASIDVTIVELKPFEDDLYDEEFLEIDEKLMNDDVVDEYSSKDVYIINYKESQEGEEELFKSTGIIKKVKEIGESYILEHTCDTEKGSSGGPIILYNHKVIGVHVGCSKKQNFNKATLLQYPIKEYNKKLKNKLIFKTDNKIKMTYKINKGEDEIKILGKKFVDNNKDKCKLLINKKESDLCEYFKYDKNEISKNDDSLKITLKEIKAGSVEDMSYMFHGCSSLKTVYLYTSNTKNVKDMKRMFYGCSSLESLNLKSFNTQNVTDMYAMFHGCSNLTSLNLSSFKTQNVTVMRAMFCGCEKLTSLDLSKFDTQNVTNMSFMFGDCNGGCSSLKTLDLSSFKTENVISMENMFARCSSLESVNLSKFKTENVKAMNHMFYCCSSLSSLDLSSFKTENVTNMYAMFCGCKNLTSLKLSSFNTKNVTDMSFMFGDSEEGCSSLKSLDLSSFNTENVTNMQSMFCNCSELTSLDLKSFNTENVNNMYAMFYRCSSLKSLDLTSFDTKKVTNMENMFGKCFSLEELNLSKFNVDNASIKAMFSRCDKLNNCKASDKKIVNEFKKNKGI